MAISRNCMPPTGGSVSRRLEMPLFLDDYVLERILWPDNVERAWRRVRANGGAPGVDGMSLKEYPAFARDHWAEIRQSLLAPKRSGDSRRQLGISLPPYGERISQSRPEERGCSEFHQS